MMPRKAAANRLRILADEIENAHFEPAEHLLNTCKYIHVDKVEVVGRHNEDEPWKLIYWYKWQK